MKLIQYQEIYTNQIYKNLFKCHRDMELFMNKPQDLAILLRYAMYLLKLFYISRIIRKLRVCSSNSRICCKY